MYLYYYSNNDPIIQFHYNYDIIYNICLVPDKGEMRRGGNIILFLGPRSSLPYLPLFIFLSDSNDTFSPPARSEEGQPLPERAYHQNWACERRAFSIVIL
jgi:hypothetical protein